AGVGGLTGSNLRRRIARRRWCRHRLGFFFQAEDGIRGKLVTGVQTCALPISARHLRGDGQVVEELLQILRVDRRAAVHFGELARSEERRVGKECRSRWSRYQ